MDRNKFEEIMKGDEIGGSKLCEPGDNALKGLLIISKYLPTKGIEGAGHDVIYSAGVDEIIDAGITEGDARELRAQNWMLKDDDYLACFV